MDSTSSPLGALPGYLLRGSGRLPKRERTRLGLMEAAVAVFAERGVEATTIQDIALAARVATGTFYNHFKAKEELLSALALWVGEGFCQRIVQSYASIADGAERMAIGNRRYVRLAIESPRWALLFLQVNAAAPEASAELEKYALADLRLGVKQQRFRISHERAALDLISGAITFGMRTVALGHAPSKRAVPGGYDSAVATLILQGLGMASDEAISLAHRPLPAMPED
ncbi:MAG TPA: helix-turn-helix domain-containing protein [Polyangiales bacterium]|nr:helix-turn-helix domain-containing protein [Polyangiales bacterium]